MRLLKGVTLTLVFLVGCQSNPNVTQSNTMAQQNSSTKLEAAQKSKKYTDKELIRTQGVECGKYSTSIFTLDAISDIANYSWSKPHKAIEVYESKVCGLDNWRPASREIAKISKLKRTYDYRLVSLLCNAYYRTGQFSKAEHCLNYYTDNYYPSVETADIRDAQSLKAAYFMLQVSMNTTLGNYQKALDYTLKAESYMISQFSSAYSVKDPHADVLFLRGYSDGAISASQLGDKEIAYRFLSYIPRFETTVWLSSSTFDGIIAAHEARGYLALGDVRKAQDALNRINATGAEVFARALVAAGTLGMSELIGVGASATEGFSLDRFYMEGKLCFIKGDYDCALDKYTELLNGRYKFDPTESLKVALNNRPDLYYAINYELGIIESKRQNNAQAIEYFFNSSRALESQRSNISTDAAKIGFVGGKLDVYNEIIRLLVEKNAFSKAFEYAERAKSRALVDMLASKQKFASTTSPSNTVELLAQLDRAERESLLIASTSSSRVRTRSAVVEKQAAIKKVDAELASLVTVTSISTKDIQKELGRNETVVEYFGNNERLYAFIITKQKVDAVELGSVNLDKLVGNYRRALSRYNNKIYMQSSKALHDAVIKPVKSYIKTKQVTFVPHGALHYAPFASLYDGSMHLIDSYQIRMLPSASVLTFLNKTTPYKQDKLLSLGNPDLGDARFDLPGAEEEAILVSKISRNAKVLLRSKATETALKTYGHQFKKIHFAMHGVFDNGEPLASGLLMTQDDENDGKLTVSELYELQLNTDLVTLSACETALGETTSGDDVIGFTRGFLYAGASSIVSSLWEVEDKATKFMMVRFYQYIAEKMTKADSLRLAQLDTRKKYDHPYFWAAFQLTGGH